MKYTLSILIYLVFALPSYAEETGNDINFKSGLNIGFRTLNFEQEFNQGPLSIGAFSTQPANRSAAYKQTFRSADLSATANWSDFYITANYETTIDSENGAVSTSYSDATNSLENDFAFDFSRDDYAINVGWNVIDNFSVFAGYKAGETKTSRDTAFGTPGVPQGRVDSSFKESGPFVGISYSWVFNPGVLTFSTAYAYMTGKYDESGDEIIFARTLTPTHVLAVVQNAMEYEGHTDGISANLSWNVLMSEHFAYYYGVRWQQYKFNANTDLTWKSYDIDISVPSYIVVPLKGTGDVDNSETITAFYAGINYLF